MTIFGLTFGLRNVKTGISVFICILISFLLQRETYVVSTITAVFTLREDHQNTLKYGKHRIAGNTFGALASMVCIAIFTCFGFTPIVQIIAIPLVIMCMIALLAKFDYNEGTVGACATLLTILFMVPQTESYGYAFNRVIDSFIGMGVAIMVNRFLPVHRLHLKAKNTSKKA